VPKASTLSASAASPGGGVPPLSSPDFDALAAGGPRSVELGGYPQHSGWGDGPGHGTQLMQAEIDNPNEPESGEPIDGDPIDHVVIDLSTDDGGSGSDPEVVAAISSIRCAGTQYSDEEDGPESPAKGVCPGPEESELSTHQSENKLNKLVDAVARGKHDWAFGTLGRTTSNSTSLDLCHEAMKTVNSKIQEVWVEYNKEFPPIQETRAQIAPNTTIEQAALGGPTGLGEATGLGASSLQDARSGTLAGKVSYCTNRERGLHGAGMTNNATPAAYVGARQWLENYADRFAEWSPMDGRAYLPAGSKHMYYYSYCNDITERHGLKPEDLRQPAQRRRQGVQTPTSASSGIASDAAGPATQARVFILAGVVGSESNGMAGEGAVGREQARACALAGVALADLSTFLKAWQTECPWLVVHHTVSMFTRCGVCENLNNMLIDQTPRGPVICEKR